MKHYIQTSLWMLAALWGLASCEKEEMMNYEGVDALYFDVQYGAEHGNDNVWAHQYYTYVSFASLDNAESTELKLKVCVAGSVTDYDRPFQVEVVPDSTTAITPDEYDALSTEQIIKAGENHTYITLTAKRTERMLTDTVKIQLRLIPNEYFSLPFSEVGNIPGRWTDTQTAYSSYANPTVHNIFMNNVLEQPAGWNSVTVSSNKNAFGQFTAKKYQLMMDVTGFTVDDFENRAIMQSGRQALIARLVSSYLMEQYNKGRDYWVLDSDGSMMWVSGVSWAHGTMPEEMLD